MTEERDETPVMPAPLKPEACKHDDLERVGAYKVVCFKCKHIANINDLIAKKPGAWKPLN